MLHDEPLIGSLLVLKVVHLLRLGQLAAHILEVAGQVTHVVAPVAIGHVDHQVAAGHRFQGLAHARERPGEGPREQGPDEQYHQQDSHGLQKQHVAHVVDGGQDFPGRLLGDDDPFRTQKLDGGGHQFVCLAIGALFMLEPQRRAGDGARQCGRIGHGVEDLRLGLQTGESPEAEIAAQQIGLGGFSQPLGPACQLGQLLRRYLVDQRAELFARVPGHRGGDETGRRAAAGGIRLEILERDLARLQGTCATPRLGQTGVAPFAGAQVRGVFRFLPDRIENGAVVPDEEDVVIAAGLQHAAEIRVELAVHQIVLRAAGTAIQRVTLARRIRISRDVVGLKLRPRVSVEGLPRQRETGQRVPHRRVARLDQQVGMDVLKIRLDDHLAVLQGGPELVLGLCLHDVAAVEIGGRCQGRGQDQGQTGDDDRQLDHQTQVPEPPERRPATGTGFQGLRVACDIHRRVPGSMRTGAPVR